jgi:serine/threonine protein kinase
LKEGEKIDDYFDFGEEIYCGGAKGKVLMAKQRSNGDEVVVKVRVKSLHKAGERTWRTVMSQVYGMRDSEHVLDINEIYEDDSHFYVIMPKCNGGELFEFLATETEVPEGECKRIIREILTAVGHLHGNNIVHRDIKPENIMFNLEANDPSSPKTVKLIDFDTCFGWAAGTPKNRRFVGTPGYIAPEALLGEICPQSDLWSIGVILYILMTGEMPWSSLVSLEDGVVGSPGAMRMYNGLKEEVMDWDKEPWPEFPLARDLCQRLIAFDVDARVADVQQALAHPWLADRKKSPPEVSPVDASCEKKQNHTPS